MGPIKQIKAIQVYKSFSFADVSTGLLHKYTHQDREQSPLVISCSLRPCSMDIHLSFQQIIFSGHFALGSILVTKDGLVNKSNLVTALME